MAHAETQQRAERQGAGPAPLPSTASVPQSPNAARRPAERDYAAEVGRLNADLRACRREIVTLRTDFSAALRSAALPVRGPAAAVQAAQASAAAQEVLDKQVLQLREEVQSMMRGWMQEAAAVQTWAAPPVSAWLAPDEACSRPETLVGGPDDSGAQAHVATLGRHVEHLCAVSTEAKITAEEAASAVRAQLQTSRLIAERLGVAPVLLGRPAPEGKAGDGISAWRRLCSVSEEAEALAAGVAHAFAHQKVDSSVAEAPAKVAPPKMAPAKAAEAKAVAGAGAITSGTHIFWRGGNGCARNRGRASAPPSRGLATKSSPRSDIPPFAAAPPLGMPLPFGSAAALGPCGGDAVVAH